MIKGMYCFSRSDRKPEGNKKAHLFGSGAIMAEVLQAKELLENMGIPVDVWSVTSYNELSREALDVERSNSLAADQDPTIPYVQALLGNETGVFVAASDYMKALPLSIARWIPGPFSVLGTDGYGLSESLHDLRTHFEVSAEYIAYTVLAALTSNGQLTTTQLQAAAKTLAITPEKPNPARGRTSTTP